MKIFLTGSTGLLGINTVEAALAQGHEVLALARDTDKARRVLPDDRRIRIVQGDLNAPDAWFERLGDADVLVHCAAYFREYFGRGEHEAKLRALNVQLPVDLVRAADRAGLKRSVIVSSSGVINARSDGQPATEADVAQGAVPENRYFMSKVEMESELSAIAPDLRHRVVIVRPGWMFGPNDYAPTSAGQMVIDLLKRGVLQLPKGEPICTADARDVAKGIIAALEVPEPSPIYNLAGQARVAVDTLNEFARQAGHGRVQAVPAKMALALSAVLELPSRLRGVPNPIPRVGVITLCRGSEISSERAMRELGVAFRPFPETARDTVEFFRREF